jgi:hypothetical protein
MANELSENLQYVTLHIENDVGQRVGTGFLVADTASVVGEFGETRVTWGPPKTRAYLVTARHVLGENASVISCSYDYGLRYNAIGDNGLEMRARRFRILSDSPNWAVHPDEKVDVAALDVTTWISEDAAAHLRFCPLSEIANAINLAAVDCDAGDEVFVIGYPLTLRQGRTNLPLVRKGVLATSPRRRLIDPDDEQQIRGFLVDGAILPGSSGSPVISLSKRFLGGDLAMTTYRPLVVGVVAQEWGRGKLQRYDASQRCTGDCAIEGYANLGFAHSGAAIIETIAALGRHGPTDFLKLDHDQNWAAPTGIPEWAIEHEGPAADSVTIDRIQRRLNRDRMRALGKPVIFSEFHDAPEIMGPVPESSANVATAENLISTHMRTRGPLGMNI